jgi:magnesium transporter
MLAWGYMMKSTKERSKKEGLPPGTLIYVGKKRTKKVKISIIDYDEQNYKEKVIKKVDDCIPFKESPTVTWINIDGIYDMGVIEKIGECFKLHPLILEDIVNTNQRPKMDDYDDYIFIVLKMLYYSEKTGEITSEQVSMILGKNFVISFQEQEEDVFNNIRDRIKHAKGRIRKMSADYLAYALIDAIVDHYFVILEKLSEKIETMEDSLVINPTPQLLEKVYDLKKEMITLRKSVWPLRELISGLERTESKLIEKSTDVFLRDVYDHTIQVIDSIETFRDTVSGMMDLYLSSISNKMNQIMQVLTIIATIFIPLTFITGIYGMNFDPGASPFNMPELGWYWGYISVWVVMIVIVVLMLIYFRKKKWL